MNSSKIVGLVVVLSLNASCTESNSNQVKVNDPIDAEMISSDLDTVNDLGATETSDTYTDETDADLIEAASCELACSVLLDCLASECSGFTSQLEDQVSQGCLNKCTPGQAQVLDGQSCNEQIIMIREQQGLIGDICPPQNDNAEGFNMLYIGHSFGRNFADRLPEVTAQMGIGNHRTHVVFSGGASGAPLALWDNEEKKTAAQDILDTGDINLMVMICCSEPWVENGSYSGIVNWMNYALDQNPSTIFGLAMPWIDFPESYETAAEYAELWEMGYAAWTETIDSLRNDFPNTEIFSIPHGRASGDLMTLFEMEALPEVEQLRGPSDSSIYTDEKGHAAQILKDMGALIWLSSIYGINVSGYIFDREYSTDIASMANQIVSDDLYTREP